MKKIISNIVFGFWYLKEYLKEKLENISKSASEPQQIQIVLAQPSDFIQSQINTLVDNISKLNRLSQIYSTSTALLAKELSIRTGEKPERIYEESVREASIIVMQTLYENLYRAEEIGEDR